MILKFVRGERVEVQKFFDAKMLVLKRYPKFYISDLWQRNAQGFYKQVFESKEKPFSIATIQYNGEAA